MAYDEQMTRDYLKKRFPRASAYEREHIVADWLGKERAAEGIAADFEHRVGSLEGKEVLDLGSGNGGISIAFAKRGAHVQGVDIEEDLVRIARDEAKRQNSSATFTLYDGTILPFADNSFDALVSVSVLEHVTDPVNFLSEALRVIRPDGSFYLAFPNKLHPQETHSGLFGLSYLPRPLGNMYTQLAGRSPMADQNLHFYTYFDLQRLLRMSARPGAVWRIKEEMGVSVSPLKRLAKSALRMFGISHRVFLPHVMVVCEAQKE